MADNTQLSTGTGGDLIATDDIGGTKFQRVKLVEGADGTNDGDISSANPLPVETPNLTASGALNGANAAVTISCQGIEGASWEIDTGTLVGTVVFEATDDDTNWFAVEAIRIAGAIITSTTSFADRGHFTSVSYSQIRLRVSAFTSGTSNARIEASIGGAVTRIGQALPTGDNTIGRVKITDGTDVLAISAGGAALVDGSATTQPVSGTVAVSSVIPGTGATNLGKAEDAVAASGDTGVVALALRDDVPATRTDANLDYEMLRTDNVGRLWTAVGASATSIGKAEDAASGSGEVGAAILGVRNDSLAVLTDTNFDYSHLSVDSRGILFTKITDGVDTANVTTGNALQADLTSVAGTAILTGGTAGSQGVGGLAAHAAAAAGNPVWVGGRASTALPTDVGADGDVAALWTNRNGAQVVAVSPHIGLNSDPYNLLHEAAQYTTTQTSTALITGGASEKIVVTRVQIQVGGTTAGTLQLYFAAAAAFSRGTTRAIFDGEFAPSATLKPGVVMEGPFISGTNGDDLLVTTSAAINPLTINVWYYIVV